MADPVVTPAVAPVPGATPPAQAPAFVPPVAATPAADPAAIPPAADPAAPILGPDGQPVKPTLAAEPEPVKFDAAKLTLPEGMKSDDPLFQSFASTLTDDKLDPQARGQKLLDVYKEGIKTIQEAQTKAWTDTNDAWKAAVKADPEIGGAKFEATKTTIAKAIDSLGPELSVAFRQGLDATGAGNHPAIWKGLAKLAAAFTEGGHVSGGPTGGSARPSVKDAFYPNSPDMK